MKQQLFIFLMIFTYQNLEASTQEFSTRAVNDLQHKSLQQQTRMSDLQHKKEKRFARKKLVKERHAKRQVDQARRKGQLQSHAHHINAQRTRADHSEKVRTSREAKNKNRILLQHAAKKKQTYIEHEKSQIEEKKNIHHAAREALRDMPF